MYIKNGIQYSVRHDLTSRILPLASVKVKFKHPLTKDFINTLGHSF